MAKRNRDLGGCTVGVDLGDKSSVCCAIDGEGRVVERFEVGTTKEGFREAFEGQNCRVVLETGTHSPWSSRLLEEVGCEVLVGQARELAWIFKAKDKSDRKDAERLARVGRFDPELLHPIRHRSEGCQNHLAILKARDGMVRSRSSLISMVRSLVKAAGHRLPSCNSEVFPRKAIEEIPAGLKPALVPVLNGIQRLTEEILTHDRTIQAVTKRLYPETEGLREVAGVGPLTSLALILTLESPDRFGKSRDVGPFLGLTPRRDQSGETDKALSITKAGNGYLRRLLVGCANYILGQFGPDCDLRRYGERVRGPNPGKVARQRAKVAVARKLAVLLHHLWKTGAVYDPDHTQKRHERELRGSVA